jgi:hypothetical protein
MRFLPPTESELQATPLTLNLSLKLGGIGVDNHRMRRISAIPRHGGRARASDGLTRTEVAVWAMLAVLSMAVVAYLMSLMT